MSADQLQSKILSHLKSDGYRPQKPRNLAHELDLTGEDEYHSFRDALKELMHQGHIVLGSGGSVVLPNPDRRRNEFVGTYRQNRRRFGFVVPSDPTAREDLFIPEGENNGAITGDIVRARITSTGHKDGKAIYSGRITEIIERSQKRFVGSLQKVAGEWVVMPDGNTLTEPILAPDAASRHIKPGTKVVIELTSYPEQGRRASGVITEVLGQAGEKDVDLRSVIVQHNLPGPFDEEVKAQARASIDNFDPEQERTRRVDLTNEVICTIDPDDAKDYDDAISLRQVESGLWELGVHIADVSFFVPRGTPLDLEAAKRGNSAYFPGHVIPMLPEILSNGVCSLQEAVPRLCKSAFITYDDDARPVSARFENTIIKSAKRLRYKEAQALLDHAEEIPHPDGVRRRDDYPREVLDLLDRMNELSRRLQKRRQRDGQIVLDLPEVELVLDEEGKVIDAVPEDQSFTHTLIEMFMVEANEAVARLLDSLGVPLLRRTHPEPEEDSSSRLRQFLTVAGLKLPKNMDRKALQALLAQVKGRPEAFAINLAVLKSLTRAEYSPEKIGHYALASENYCHFTSPIRRYADLTVHRLLDAFFEARDRAGGGGGKKRRKVAMDLDNVPSYDELVEIGRHISFTERRADGAEKELRQVKILELLQHHVGEDFLGVVTGITNFGIFVQMQTYLIEGVIRYENLMDDWWDVDVRGGFIRGQRSGKRIGIGDVVTVRVARINVPRRELDLAVTQLRGRKAGHGELTVPSADREEQGPPDAQGDGHRPGRGRGGKGRALQGPADSSHKKGGSKKQAGRRGKPPPRGGPPKRGSQGRRRR